MNMYFRKEQVLYVYAQSHIHTHTYKHMQQMLGKVVDILR